MPSDIYEWYSVDGMDFKEVEALCAPDQRCSGFYMCSPKGAKVDNCKHLFSPATAVLLSGVPAPSLLLTNEDSTVVAKKMSATCGGNANGATCNFPFTESTGITESLTSSTSSYDFYECSIANSERPWCFTTRPGKWGYCDCNGYNPIGLEWSLGNWSRCSKSCGSGIKTREIKCLNSTTGEELDNINLCGQSPDTYEFCNTHDCDEGCEIEHSDREICSGFYEDPLNQVASELSQKSLCKSYGCCFAQVTQGRRHLPPQGRLTNLTFRVFAFQVTDATAFKLGSPKCYKSASMPAGGCRKQAHPGTGQVTTVNQCGAECCAASALYGECGYKVGVAKLARSTHHPLTFAQT